MARLERSLSLPHPAHAPRSCHVCMWFALALHSTVWVAPASAAAAVDPAGGRARKGKLNVLFVGAAPGLRERYRNVLPPRSQMDPAVIRLVFLAKARK